MADFLNNGIPAWVLLVVGIGLFLYGAAWLWSHSSADLLTQNLFRTNRVDLPKLAQSSAIPGSGTSTQESTALVLSRAHLPVNVGQVEGGHDYTNLIYPVAGRNGLHFSPERCTSCGLCEYSCPTKAITTQDQADENKYIRQFDLTKCIYCGLCESVCPTSAIRLTLNDEPIQASQETLTVAGEVEAVPCKLCGRKIPQTDLLAERIYQAQQDADEDEYELVRQTINPHGVCLDCQKRVLEAEERICV